MTFWGLVGTFFKDTDNFYESLGKEATFKLLSGTFFKVRRSPHYSNLRKPLINTLTTSTTALGERERFKLLAGTFFKVRSFPTLPPGSRSHLPLM